MKQTIAQIAFPALLIAVVRPAGAQAAPAPPSSATCATPNASARVLAATAPSTPPIAQLHHAYGEVDVLVSLDENSRIVGASITQSPSPLLNNAALQAARSAQFQTKIVNCRPVADTYRFIANVATPPPTPPAISDYFLGTWYCESEIKSRVVKAFGMSGNGSLLMLDNAYVTADNVIALSQETYGNIAPGISMFGRFGGYDFFGMSRGWDGDALIFTGPLTNAEGVGVSATAPLITTQRVTYTRADADHFTRTFESISPGQTAYATTSRETCARIAKPGS